MNIGSNVRRLALVVSLAAGCGGTPSVGSPPPRHTHQGGVLSHLLSSTPTDSLPECEFPPVTTTWTHENLQDLTFRLPFGYTVGKLDGLQGTGKPGLDRGPIEGREWLPGLVIPTTAQERRAGRISDRWIVIPSEGSSQGNRVFDVFLIQKWVRRYSPDYLSIGTSDSWRVMEGRECRLGLGDRNARVLLARYHRRGQNVYYFSSVWHRSSDVWGQVRGVGDQPEAWAEFLRAVATMR